MSFKEYERMSNTLGIANNNKKNPNKTKKLLHGRDIACKGIERQEGKILVIGAAYAIPVQEISIRLFGLEMTHTVYRIIFVLLHLQTVSPRLKFAETSCV